MVGVKGAGGSNTSNQINILLNQMLSCIKKKPSTVTLVKLHCSSVHMATQKEVSFFVIVF